MIYSRGLKCFAIYFDIFNVTYFIDLNIAWKIDVYFINILILKLLVNMQVEAKDD